MFFQERYDKSVVIFTVNYQRGKSQPEHHNVYPANTNNRDLEGNPYPSVQPPPPTYQGQSYPESQLPPNYQPSPAYHPSNYNQYPATTNKNASSFPKPPNEPVAEGINKITIQNLLLKKWEEKQGKLLVMLGSIICS